ncbi:unnamed protein product [Prunus brigantina]
MASSSTLDLPSISHVISVRLERDNYPTWLAQIVPVLRSRRLLSYVDVLATVATKTTARDTWLALETRFASPNQNRLLQLRSDLLRTTRGDSSITDFPDRIHSITDNLALAGAPVHDSDLLAVVMNNVGPLYENTVAAAQAREKPIGMPDLEALLLSAERRLQALSSPAISSGATAMVASRGGRGGRGGRGFGDRSGFAGRASDRRNLLSAPRFGSSPNFGSSGFSHSSSSQPRRHHNSGQDLSSNRVFLSRHVLFDELSFPFHKASATAAPDSSPSSPDMPLLLPGPTFTSRGSASSHLTPPMLQAQPSLSPPATAPTASPDPPSSDPAPLPAVSAPSPSSPSMLSHIPPGLPSPPGSPSPPVTRPAPPPSRFSQTYSRDPHRKIAFPSAVPVPSGTSPPSDTSLVSVSNTHFMATRAKAGVRKPNPKYAHHALVSTDDSFEPTSFSQANKLKEWRLAMADEFNALLRAGTWILVPHTPAMNVLPNKWIFRVKRNSDGTIQRYKARLVANGFHQQPGLDYGETFSPVVNHSTIRLILALSVQFSWPVRQLDVQNAFLHGYLDEEVYMRQPVGFVDPTYPDHVCRLRHSLYGLKQAHRAWFHCFSSHLLRLGFIASQSDSSLFVYTQGSIHIYLLIYVDDILVTGSDPSRITTLISDLGRQFSMKDLGPANYFLGMELVRTPSGLSITQTKYVVDLLKRVNMHEAKPVPTPALSGRRLSISNGDPLPDPTEYRSTVGALQYLTLTRPDIAFAVNQVCQFMHQPTTAHWLAVKRILRYLNGTLTHGLFYSPSTLFLSAFSDADYAGNPNDRRSTGGYCVYLGTNLISWSSKKQRGVSRSSTEAEYRQLAYTAATLSWFRALFQDLHLPAPCPKLWCDNISALSLASNPVFHSRTRHVEVDYHYVRERVVRNELLVAYCSTVDQIADIFTKGLSSARFSLLRSKLPVPHRPVSLRGCNGR